MAAVDGVLYGDDPAQGVVEGRQFLHPDLRLAFTIPNGYGMQNGPTEVGISGNGGQAQFSTARYSGDINAYLGSVLKAVCGEIGSAHGRGGLCQYAKISVVAVSLKHKTNNA